MPRLQYARPSALPFPRQAIDVSFALVCHRGQQRDRKRVKFESFEDVVDRVRLSHPLVDAVERVARSFD